MREGILFWNMENLGGRKDLNRIAPIQLRAEWDIDCLETRDWEKNKEINVERYQRQILPISKFS